MNNVLASQLSSEAQKANSARRLVRVLTITPFYPSTLDLTQGTFISDPLACMERFGISNQTIAVQPMYRRFPSPTQAQPATWTRYFSVPGNLGLPTAGEFLAKHLLRQFLHPSAAPCFDLIHAHSGLPCGHAASILSKRLSIPFVISVHGLDSFFSRQGGKIVGNWCTRIMEDVYHSARAVVCVSEKVREQILQRVQVASTVVYNGVDTEIFAPRHERPPRLVVLSVGNLISIKGHNTLLHAFSQISAEFPDCVVEIVGDGPEYRKLVELATALNVAGRVRFLGRQSREMVASAMRRCAVFALPSEYEALGCVYLEAMSCGKPAIGCFGQGIDEVIEHGRTGMLISPGNVSELAGSLRVLFSNRTLRERIGSAARKAVLQRFTVEHQASRLAEIYRECLP